MSESAQNNRPSALIFVRILEEARHPKSKRSAERVREACDYLEKHRIPITISEVGRLCHNTGPKEQSIRNNKDLGRYVNARALEQDVAVPHRVSNRRYESKDDQANAVMYALEAEVRRQNAIREGLKRAIQNSGEYDLAATMKTGRLVRSKGSTDVLPNDISAILRGILDPKHLACFGLSIDGDRVVAPNRNNRVFIAKPEFQKLLAILRNNSKQTS